MKRQRWDLNPGRLAPEYMPVNYRTAPLEGQRDTVTPRGLRMLRPRDSETLVSGLLMLELGLPPQACVEYLPSPRRSPVEGLHAAQELLVVAAVDEHLGVVLD